MREKIEVVTVVWRGGDGDGGGDSGVVGVEVGVGCEEVVSRAEGDGCCYERTGGEWRTSS